MTSERIQRRIDILLDEADEAVAIGRWSATVPKMSLRRGEWSKPSTTFSKSVQRKKEDYSVTLFGCSSKHPAGIIRDNMTFIFVQNNRIIGIVLAAAFLLLLPLLAMQITNEVVWDLADFAVAGAFLVGTGLTYELIARKAGNIAYRAAVGVALAAALLIVWINVAVGIIGNEENPANLMYIGVLAVGITGAIIARLRPHGMARTLFATALAQALVPVIALIVGKPQLTSVEVFLGVLGVLGVNAFFVMLFVGSAWLFRRAARKHN